MMSAAPGDSKEQAAAIPKSASGENSVPSSPDEMPMIEDVGPVRSFGSIAAPEPPPAPVAPEVHGQPTARLPVAHSPAKPPSGVQKNPATAPPRLATPAPMPRAATQPIPRAAGVSATAA